MNEETKETKWIFCIVTLITFSSDIFAENAKRPYRKGTRRQIPSVFIEISVYTVSAPLFDCTQLQCVGRAK